MRIRFWGVRGSLPAPLTPSAMREKISEVLARATPGDLADGESRERFLSGLPPLLFGTAGGNTPCVSVSVDGLDGEIVFDCGSGIRDFGLSEGHDSAGRYHVFLSHFHWDHLHGLPFFVPAYSPSAKIDFHSPVPGFRDLISDVMTVPHYPITLEKMTAEKTFRVIDAPVALGPATVSFRKMRHPGDSFAYRVNHDGKKFVYVTDSELGDDDMAGDGFFTDADVAAVDAQFSPEEAPGKVGWGHSTYEAAVRFAEHWGIRHLVLFHHDPEADDARLERFLDAARRFQSPDSGGRMRISLAREGCDMVL